MGKKKKKYSVDFTYMINGGCVVEATSKEEAEEIVAENVSAIAEADDESVFEEFDEGHGALEYLEASEV